MKPRINMLVLSVLVLLALTYALRADKYSYTLRHTGTVAPGVASVDVVSVSPAIPATNNLESPAGGFEVTVEFNPDSILSGLSQLANNDLNGLLFCMDIVQTASTDWHEYDLVNVAAAPSPASFANHPMGAGRGNWLTYLAQQYWNDTYLDLGSTDDDIRYAALQLAIWEIIYEDDGSWNVGLGDLILDGSDSDDDLAEAEANKILGDIVTTVGAGNVVDFIETDPALSPQIAALVNPTYQDFLVRTTEFVPEPGSVALAALGLLGLVTRRKRRS